MLRKYVTITRSNLSHYQITNIREPIHVYYLENFMNSWDCTYTGSLLVII